MRRETSQRLLNEMHAIKWRRETAFTAFLFLIIKNAIPNPCTIRTIMMLEYAKKWRKAHGKKSRRARRS